MLHALVSYHTLGGPVSWYIFVPLLRGLLSPFSQLESISYLVIDSNTHFCMLCRDWMCVSHVSEEAVWIGMETMKV